jgi:hypothetical protein
MCERERGKKKERSERMCERERETELIFPPLIFYFSLISSLFPYPYLSALLCSHNLESANYTEKVIKADGEASVLLTVKDDSLGREVERRGEESSFCVPAA